MDHMQSVNAIQTQDVPAFLASLEIMYGKKWVEENFALMAIVTEEGSAGAMFRTMGNGTNGNLMKIAHAVIRSIALMTLDHHPEVKQIDAIKGVMNTLWLIISKDLGREGVPDSIFSAVMEKQAEDASSSSDETPTI